MRNVSRHLRVDPAEVEQVVDALRAARFEVRVPADWKDRDGRQYIEVINVLMADDNIEEEQRLSETIYEIACGSGATTVESAGGGVVIQGGTPYHAWLRVIVDDTVTDLKILAADDYDIAKDLARVAGIMGLDVTRLDAERPAPWPKI